MGQAFASPFIWVYLGFIRIGCAPFSPPPSKARKIAIFSLAVTVTLTWLAYTGPECDYPPVEIVCINFAGLCCVPLRSSHRSSSLMSLNTPLLYAFLTRDKSELNHRSTFLFSVSISFSLSFCFPPWIFFHPFSSVKLFSKFKNCSHFTE